MSARRIPAHSRRRRVRGPSRPVAVALVVLALAVSPVVLLVVGRGQPAPVAFVGPPSSTGAGTTSASLPVGPLASVAPEVTSTTSAGVTSTTSAPARPQGRATRPTTGRAAPEPVQGGPVADPRRPAATTPGRAAGGNTGGRVTTSSAPRAVPSTTTLRQPCPPGEIDNGGDTRYGRHCFPPLQDARDVAVPTVLRCKTDEIVVAGHCEEKPPTTGSEIG